MDRRTTICIWIILLGLANFLAYSIVYLHIGGEAIHGQIGKSPTGETVYMLKGPGLNDVPTSSAVYVYSSIHSISIWLTVGAIMLAMLTLAKERIASSMRSTIMRGRTFITILATIIAFVTSIITIWFVLQFAGRFGNHVAQTQGASEVRMIHVVDR